MKEDIKIFIGVAIVIFALRFIVELLILIFS